MYLARIKYSVITMMLIISPCIHSQSIVQPRISPIYESGLGYPIALGGHTAYSDFYLNLGINRHFSNKFTGLLLSTQYRAASRGDIAFGPSFRIGTFITDKYKLSLDLGIKAYSKKFGSFNGATVGLQFDRASKYGFHARYDHFSNETLQPEKNLVIGFHLSGRNTTKIGLPIIVGAAVIAGILSVLISMSK